MSEHYPEEWGPSDDRRLTCVCGHSLPCPNENRNPAPTAKMKYLERLCMAHRYLYYVKGTPVIEDRHYDDIESTALLLVSTNSPLRKPGSDLESNYDDETIKLAREMYDKSQNIR